MNKIEFCQGCGCQLPPKTKNCPRCGKKVKRKNGCLTAILIIVGLFIGFSILVSVSDPVYEVDVATNDMASEQKIDMNSETTSNESQISVNVGELSEQEIFNNNGVRIVANGIESDWLCYRVNIFIENNSSLSLGFNARAYGVNGIMTGNNIYAMDTDVAPGKKANTTLDIDKSFIKENGISEIRCIDVLFWAYDNDKAFKEFDTAQLEIKTSLYDNTHDSLQGKNLYSSNGVKVDCLSDKKNEFTYLISNSTGNYFSCDFTDLSINDYTVTDIDYDLTDIIVLNNCQSVVTLTINDSFFSTNKIDSINSIDWKLNIRPNEKYENEYKTDFIIDTITQ